MSDSPKSKPAWLKLVCTIIGVLLVLAGAVGVVFTGMKLWALMHSKGGLMADSAHPLTWQMGNLMGSLLILFIGTWLTQVGAKKKPTLEEQALAMTKPMHMAPAPHTKSSQRAAKRWQSCNVLEVTPAGRHLWNFNAGKNGFSPNSEQTLSVAEPLPGNLVARDWKTLLQPRLNIAWLPVDQVFLRVAQLPVGAFDETLSMVELQLEKLSPLPVTQIVWSIQIMPQHADNLQTVIVTMIASDLVEKFLGDLESKGFLADRLELPILDQLLATSVKEDGAYIYPYSGSEKFTALVAWWHGGVLRSLGLVHVPTADGNDAILKEQLAQMAWSGELEGWLSGPPRWYLVTDQATAANWQPLFQSWVGRQIAVLEPLGRQQLAVANANRAARGETESGMLPVEYAKRYTQEFHDRLWMRGLAGLLVIYLAGVTIYMGAAAYRTFKTETLEQETASRSRSYTNALQLKAQMVILQNRQALKFASLDCWKKTAELLPEGVTVQTLEFRDGKHYSLSGVAPTDKREAVSDFSDALRKATLSDGQPMFEKMDVPGIRLNPGGTTLTWSFSGELARVEDSK